ncbi:uncharacterized protein LOC119179561 isoform X2 [Rhipicephalus microplus]|uniref:uncharacterized protein LOC119179561 isoform X2 n=1 Tax=Rhipicephalus microplus TaxID=6941 RepID=UPI003F6CFF3A
MCKGAMNMCWYLFLLIAVAPSQEKATNGTSKFPNPPPAPGCSDVNGQSPATPSTSNTSLTMTTPSTTTTQATTTTSSSTTTSSTTTTQAAPGCGDVNGQSPGTNSSTSTTVTATPSTSNTSSTMTTPSTTTTQATTTTPSTTTTSSTTTAGVPCHYNGTTYNASFHEALRDPCEFWWCLPNGTMEVTKCELELPRPSVYPGCTLVSLGGYFPYCCRYQRVC